MELPEIVSLGKPAALDLPGPRPWPRVPLASRLSKYVLLERVPCGGDEECYIARINGVAGFESYCFVRRFPLHRLEDGTRDALIRQAHITHHGVAQMFELGVDDDRAYTCHEHIQGASLADLARSGQRIPWFAAVVLVHDVCARLAYLRDLRVGAEQLATPDLAVSPARIKLAERGLVLCLGIPHVEPPSWHETMCAIVHPILSLAATPDERALLASLFGQADPDALWVASDAIVQRHPELDPALPLVLLAIAGRAATMAAHTHLAEHAPIHELRGLWNLAIDVVHGRVLG